MEKILSVSFPGGKKVVSAIGEFVIASDQPVYAGGDGTDPTPFDGFLASLANCAGYFALDFCQSRNIDMTGVAIRMKCKKNSDTKLFDTIVFDVSLPSHFPEKYESALIRSMDLCSVKKHIMNPPHFDIVIVRS